MKISKDKALFTVLFATFVVILYLLVSKLAEEKKIPKFNNEHGNLDTTKIKAVDWNDQKLDADRKAYYDYLYEKE
jgi:hypothetical protein